MQLHRRYFVGDSRNVRRAFKPCTPILRQTDRSGQAIAPEEVNSFGDFAASRPTRALTKNPVDPGKGISGAEGRKML